MLLPCLRRCRPAYPAGFFFRGLHSEGWVFKIWAEISDMTAKNFFRSCRDLVLWRWEVRFNAGNGLTLVQVVDLAVEHDRRLLPVPVVAVDRFGARFVDSPDFAVAASALELNREFTALVFWASVMDRFILPLAAEVRGELISALTIPKQFQISRIPKRG